MKNCISRRAFLKAAGILGAAGALAACGGSSSSTTTASSAPASSAAGAAASSTSIKLWTYPIGGWGNDETVQNLVSSFNAKYPDIKVTVEYLDYTNGDDQVNTAIEGGSAPDLIMEGPERLVANWGAKGVMAPLNDLWTDDAKKDIYESVESACKDTAGNYYEYPLCMTAHCMAVNMTKVKEVGADKYIDTDKHTWSTEGFLNTVDALYILEDLYNLLRKQEEAESQRLATALEIYVNGSLKVFNHRTNVELNNRLVCFDIKDLGKQLKKLGMLIVQDQVWNRVTVNRSAHRSTRYYIDEFHLLLKEEQTAAYSVEIWKRFRKWGGIPTGITQNVKDLLASREIENIFENSDFILMLNQASGDRQILAKQLNISTHQLSYVTNSGEGEGLIFYGNTIIPFKDRFDNTLMLYALMSSKPEDVEKREKLGIKGRDDS